MAEQHGEFGFLTRMVHEPLGAPGREATPLNPEAQEILRRETAQRS